MVLNAAPCPYRCGTTPAMAMCTASSSPSQMASWWRCHRQGPAVESELWPPVSKLIALTGELRRVRITPLLLC